MWERVRSLRRAGHIAARGLAVRDSRAFVRALFLASLVETDAIGVLRTPSTADEIAAHLRASRPDRVLAWLRVGVELRELEERRGRYRPTGRRTKALVNGDAVLRAHYRSMLEYQAPVYGQLGAVLRGDADRDDLRVYAETIAQVSRAAEPFVVPALAAMARDLRPARVLDAGCGTGIYLEALLRACPDATGVGIDLDRDVVSIARGRIINAGLGSRAELVVGDVRGHLEDPRRGGDYDLIMFVNNVYYFAVTERAGLFAEAARRLRPGGRIVVVTQTAPGSVASAQLDLLLRVQSGNSALPSVEDLRAALIEAGLRPDNETRRLVPFEPFHLLIATTPSHSP